MQNPNQNSHLHRTQNSKEKRKTSESHLKSENRQREKNTIAPMSTEMKEVLAGLARFDLLPENSQQSEELILPVITKKQIGSRKSQQVSMREKYSPSINKTYGSRHVESSSRFSGNEDIYLSKSPKLARPRILIDRVDNNELKQDFENSPPCSGRFRSITYPCKSHGDESKKDELFSKMQEHLLSREKIRTSFEERSINELKLDGPRRPRAATFPYYHEFSTSEFNQNVGIASLRDHDNLISGKASSSLSDRQVYPISKPAGKTTSKDEMSAIVNRCEEWFHWREGRRKFEKHRR